MVEICQYNESDVQKIVPYLRPVFRDELGSRSIQIAAENHVLTFWSEDRVVAIVGGRPLCPGVLQAWALISDESSKVALDFTRGLRFVLSEFLQKYHRIQISVRDGYEMEARWAKTLGFTREGLMKSYGADKRDCWLYGRVA